MLKYVEEISVTEIARVLEISEHAVESRLARARKALRKRLGEGSMKLELDESKLAQMKSVMLLRPREESATPT